jgi:hypothetical protein
MPRGPSTPTEEADYLVLDQSRYGTGLRHDAVVHNLCGLGGVVVDLGCGTGLLLERIVQAEFRPTFHLGVDGLPEREVPLALRRQRLRIPGSFWFKPSEAPFWDLDVHGYTTAMAIGIAGYPGLDTGPAITRLVGWMRDAAHYGAISFPIIYPDIAPSPYLTRWKADDLCSLPGLGGASMIKLEREVVVIW